MAGVVPEPIRQRVQKSQWGDQFKQGFLVKDQGHIESVLRQPGTLDRYVSIDALSAAYGRCATGRITEEDGMNLWLGVTLGLWLNQGSGD